VGDGASYLDALGETAGELRRVGVGALGEVELLQELLSALGCVGAGEAEVEAVEVDVFKDGARAVQSVVLRDDADAAAGECGICDPVNTMRPRTDSA